MGLVNGLSPVSFMGDVVLSNADGTVFTTAESRNASICVGGNCNLAPEPATLLLVGGALSALAIIRRRRQAA